MPACLRGGRGRRAHTRAARRRLTDIFAGGVRQDSRRGQEAKPDSPQLLHRNHFERRIRAVCVHPGREAADRRDELGDDELREVQPEEEGDGVRHGVSEHLRKDDRNAQGHERRERESGARMLRQRPHPRTLAARRHGDPEAAFPIFVHRQRARRHSADGRVAAAPDQDPSARHRVGGHRHLPLPLAHARDGAGSRRQHPYGPRRSPLFAERRDGEVQRRNGRGRGEALPRRRAEARERGRGASDPRDEEHDMIARPYQAIVVGVSDGVATVVLNRPERRNAIGAVMTNELLWALEDATADVAVRSIVITGAGKSFGAGGDFSQMTGGSDSAELPHKGDFKDLMLALFYAQKPVIARVNGHAMGGGLGLVAASTFAVASTSAKLGTPEIDVGLFPFQILAVLERVMTRRRLLEMMFSGERLTAEEAAEAGLVNRAVSESELDGAVAHYTRLVASKSPSTVRLGLKALRDADGPGLSATLPLLFERFVQCLGTDDAREGLAAFLEKRPPTWTGR